MKKKYLHASRCVYILHLTCLIFHMLIFVSCFCFLFFTTLMYLYNYPSKCDFKNVLKCPVCFKLINFNIKIEKLLFNNNRTISDETDFEYFRMIFSLYGLFVPFPYWGWLSIFHNQGSFPIIITYPMYP